MLSRRTEEKQKGLWIFCGEEMETGFLTQVECAAGLKEARQLLRKVTQTADCVFGTFLFL